MIHIPLTEKHATLLIKYIDHAVEQTHYGGGEISTPEEDFLRSKIRISSGSLDLSLRHFILLLEYILDVTRDAVALLPSDQEIILLLYDSLSNHVENLKKQHGILPFEEALGTIEQAFFQKWKETVRPEIVNEVQEKSSENLSAKISKASKRVATGEVDKARVFQSKSRDEKQLLKDIIRKTKGKGIF